MEKLYTLGIVENTLYLTDELDRGTIIPTQVDDYFKRDLINRVGVKEYEDYASMHIAYLGTYSEYHPNYDDMMDDLLAEEEALEKLEYDAPDEEDYRMAP